MSDSLRGSLLHRGTNLASHFSNFVQDFTNANKLSFVILYVDVVATCASLVHSFGVDLPLSEAVAHLMKATDIPSQCFFDLRTELSKIPTLVEAEVPPHLRNVALTCCLIVGSFSTTSRDEEPHTINCSSKQGVPCADILFALFIARILKPIRLHLVEE